MGSPPRLCPLCARPGRFTVEVCEECHRPHCQRHIRWIDGRWLCRRCGEEAEQGGARKRAAAQGG